MLVSFYTNINSVKENDTRKLEDILLDIQTGEWKELVEAIRREPVKSKKDKLKKLAPNFTASGTFSKRSDDALQTPSNFIAVDIDNVDDIDNKRIIINNDEHTYCCFRSIGGQGLCVIIKIDSNLHKQCFESLKYYFSTRYGIKIDPSCGNISRTRFVSYDPDLEIKSKSKQFNPIKIDEAPHQVANNTFYYHSTDKFQRLLSIINTDITGDYYQWFQIGRAIANEFGQNGLDYFHQISKFSTKYDREYLNKQYKEWLKAPDKRITINTVYYWAKQHGYSVSSHDEDRIAKQAFYAKQAGKPMPEAATEQERKIIQEVYTQSTEEKKDSKSKNVNIDDVNLWIRSCYPIKKNIVTRAYELYEKEVEEEDFHFMFLEAKKMFDKLSREIFDYILFSSLTPKYNPIMDYLDTLQYDGVDYLEDLSKSITSDTGTPEWRKNMLTKWLLGMIETIYTGAPNILLLVLAGEKNTGKTEFFKRLLPDQLQRFFANSQLDKGKDDELLMTQKLMIFDDEYSGKSKQDSKHMKRMLSSNTFTLREPYGRKNITLRRIATLCGTCNETEILNDPTGNRRIIVIEATGRFDFKLYNSVDKQGLISQLKQMYLDGHRSTLSSEEIDQLEGFTAGRYGEISIEAEMIEHLFESPENADNYDYKPVAVIKDYIETHSKQHIGPKKLGQELRKLGYKRISKGKTHGFLIKAKGDRRPERYNIYSNVTIDRDLGVAPF
jgi:predicted P-loop ATPase